MKASAQATFDLAEEREIQARVEARKKKQSAVQKPPPDPSAEDEGLFFYFSISWK